MKSEVLHLFRCVAHTLTHTFTHKHFYTQTPLHTVAFTHTQTLLHTDTFTHGNFYPQKLLHTHVFLTHTLAQKCLIELLMWNASTQLNLTGMV